MISCDFTCPEVIYLTLASARFSLASSYHFAIIQKETGWEWALNIDFWHGNTMTRLVSRKVFAIYHVSSITFQPGTSKCFIWNHLQWGANRRQNRAAPPCSLSLGDPQWPPLSVCAVLQDSGTTSMMSLRLRLSNHTVDHWNLIKSGRASLTMWLVYRWLHVCCNHPFFC